MITRNPTMVAECGCPYDRVYDEGSLGWHLTSNHPEIAPEVRQYFGNTWVDCVDRDDPDGEATVHRFKVNQYFRPHLTAPTHMLVCERCGMHLHAKFEVAPSGLAAVRSGA